MNNIYTAILILVTVVTAIYKVSKWLKESKESNSDNIWIESLKISLPITGCVVLFIVLVYFTNINEGIIYDILSILYMIVIFIVIIRGAFVFLIKEGYKDKYGDIIHKDCIRYRKESDNKAILVDGPLTSGYGGGGPTDFANLLRYIGVEEDVIEKYIFKKQGESCLETTFILVENI